MEYTRLSETVKVKTISESDTEGVFEVSGLYVGYGLTLGNAFRRVLLSSLPGAAITQVKIKGTKHEFSTIPGVKEDVVEIILNLKKVRFKFYADEPQVLTLKAKGEKNITAANIETSSLAEVINPQNHILTLTSKNAEIEMELTVEKGLGYVPVEARKSGKLPIGVIAIDTLFTPVISVNFKIENMRVGERTDYNKLTFSIKTDGSISPSNAFHKAANILKDHVGKMAEIEVEGSEEKETVEEPAKTEKKEKKASKKKK